MISTDIFKKKILYLSSHRGTKEMDIILSNFVNQYINSFTNYQLQELYNMLNIDDEVLFKLYFNRKVNLNLKENTVIKKFKCFRKINNGGEGGIRTHE